MADGSQNPRIHIIAGEHSGDVLGGQLMAAIAAKRSVEFEFSGVGGEGMAAQGLRSLFPLSDVAVMGPVAILKRLPVLINRVYQAVDGAVSAQPDVVVIIDSPEFTHPIAKRIRKRMPDVPIINYVSPSVWAWRPGRARRMARYIDHVLALLPFEPDAHKQLGGPDCTYVGHSLAERLDEIEAMDTEDLAGRLGFDVALPVVAVLPGSRPSEVRKLLDVFWAALELLEKKIGVFNIIIPTVASVRPLIETATRDWSGRVEIVEGDLDKFASFKLSDAALAASGTVTLELAVAGTPMVVAYRVDRVAASLHWLVKVSTFVLPNLVIGRNAIPEFMQDDCTPENLCDALYDLLTKADMRDAQLDALAQARACLGLGGARPSDRAADIVLSYLDK